MHSTRPYDKALIGTLVGWGGEHVIFKYGKDEVIKFSWHVFFSGRFGVRKLVRDYALGEKYFKNYLLPTDIRVWSDGSKAVEIQPFVACRSFTRDDLANEKLHAQLREIFALHAAMRKEAHITFDMFGFKGLMGFLAHHEISNIKVLPGDKVVILDFTVLTIRAQWFEYPIFLFIRWARRRQQRIIERYWSDIN